MYRLITPSRPNVSNGKREARARLTVLEDGCTSCFSKAEPESTGPLSKHGHENVLISGEWTLEL